ncbi:MAG: hypothetical protein R2882_06015 [Gemmatimonadales bacterium]
MASAPSDQAAEHNTVRDPLRTIAIWELEDHHFAFDSSILLLPTMTEDLAVDRVARANPGAPIATPATPTRSVRRDTTSC